MLLVTLVLAAPAVAAGGEVVTVELASGRTFTAEIDPRSDDTTLWLRSGDASAYLQRPVQWQRVVRAEREGQPLSVAELRQIVRDMERPGVEPPVPPPSALEYRGVFAEPLPGAVEAIAATRAIPVRSVAAEALVANWDADVETDGLIVRLFPLGPQGQVVPVDGSAEVELFAPQRRRFHEAPQAGGSTVGRIAHWTVAIRQDDFGPEGLLLELPFQAVHPEFDLQTLPHGLVHVRLVVPGQGVFDTSLDHVRIRPWSPLRDDVWRNGGRRFFPTEHTGRPP